MPAVEDLPTIGEQYATAMESGNLRVTERRTDADIIMAAGMARDHRGGHLAPLATSLYRLRCEFDSVKAVMRLGKALSLTDRLMVLMELKSLANVKLNMGSIAIGFAVDSGYIKVADDGSGTILCEAGEDGQKLGKDLSDVFRTTGQAIDLWLSPLCHSCDGTGHSLKGGVPQHVCGTCGGTGQRDANSSKKKSAVFRDADDRKLGRKLLSEMDRLVSGVEEGMRRKLQRGRDGTA